MKSPIRIALMLQLLMLIVVAAPFVARAEDQLSVKVGVWGDDASIGNTGITAKIRTMTYAVDTTSFDYFWIGDNLENGAFIQLGYGLEPGFYCLKGFKIRATFSCTGRSEFIAYSDARWQWQYWPNRFGPDFYYEIGPTGSAGENGTWHSYSIEPHDRVGWTFSVDNNQVGIAEFEPARSIDPMLAVAEKTTNSGFPGRLGPVEFTNLSYFKNSVWHEANSLVALSDCSSTICTGGYAYGTSVMAPSIIAVGSGLRAQRNGDLIWTSSYVMLRVKMHPDTSFYITTVTGRQLYRGDVAVEIPKGMYANVSLSGSSAPARGLLGIFGAVDEFQGWIGDAGSQNQALTLLMDGDKTIEATWVTNLTTPAIIAVILVVALVTVLIWKIFRTSVVGCAHDRMHYAFEAWNSERVELCKSTE